MNKDYKYAKFININGKYKAYNTTEEIINLQSEEISRLNNIINELEKWLKNNNYGFNLSSNAALNKVLDKLKELKDSDKE